MGREISRTTGMVYEKYDKYNWRVAPKHSDVLHTSFLDVLKLSVLDDKLDEKYEKMDISYILQEGITIME